MANLHWRNTSFLRVIMPAPDPYLPYPKFLKQIIEKLYDKSERYSHSLAFLPPEECIKTQVKFEKQEYKFMEAKREYFNYLKETVAFYTNKLSSTERSLHGENSEHFNSAKLGKNSAKYQKAQERLLAEQLVFTESYSRALNNLHGGCQIASPHPAKQKKCAEIAEELRRTTNKIDALKSIRHPIFTNPTSKAVIGNETHNWICKKTSSFNKVKI